MSGDYINRGDILFQLETGFFPQSMEYTEGVAIAKSLIKSAPGVDAVEVVRCKDCKYFGRHIKHGKHSCNGYKLPYCTDNDFCSYGERRENGE